MPSALSRAYSIEDLARLAQRRLPRAIFDFFEGGAEDEVTLRRNRSAFQELVLAPQVLVDVGTVDLGTTLLGQPASMPCAIAPMGALGFGRRDADVALARAAERAGIPYILSSAATTTIEDIAAGSGGRLWFQLYALKQQELALRLMRRALDAGFEALVVTVDVPVGGKRERDARNDFGIPFRFTGRNLLDFASRPGWAASMLRHGIPSLVNLVELAPEGSSAAQLASSVGRGFDPSFTWEGLRAVRAAWPHKLLLKGVMRVDDARRALEAGCDGVIVSNHGGRQLDSANASLTALPPIAAAVGSRAEVWLDSGIRRGADIVKALALGATGVLAGRAVLYGVCAAGEPGAVRALDILRSELALTLQLCGVTRIDGIGPDLLCPGSAQPPRLASVAELSAAPPPVPAAAAAAQ